MIPKTKNSKWDSQWQSQIKALSLDLDQDKNKQVETLLQEGTALQTEKSEKVREIKQLKDEQKGLNNVFRYHRHAKADYDRLNDGTNQATHNPRQRAFLGTNAGTKYQTNGWLKNAQAHFTPSSGKLDNLYKVKISGTDYETTEEQVVNTIARVVKALQKVDSADFEAKYNSKESDATKQSQVKAYLKEIKDQAIIVGNNKDKDGQDCQPSYDFAHSYQKYDKDTDTWTAYTAPAFNYQHFFKFIELTHNQPFLSQLDSDKQKNIDKNESWQIFLKGEKWEAEKLKDYGIIIDDNKTELWKTSDSKISAPAGTGIAGWLDLAHSITQEANNQTKISAAFSNSPTQQLLEDLKTWNQGADGFLTDGTFTLPESLEEIQDIMDELETKKLNNAAEQLQIGKQIKEKNDILKQKTAEFKQKETELDTLIKEIVKKQREKLTSYQISNGFSGQHKRTVNELYQIEKVLLNIRYLENNGDTNLPSSETAENTAYDQIWTILDTALHYGSGSDKIYLVKDFKDNLAFKSVGDKQEFDIAQALSRIKAGKYTDYEGKERKIYESSSEYAKHFEELDKIVKLTDWEQAAWKALKEDKEAPEEKLTDWQSKLKTLDPLITETILTDEKMKDFQKHVNFKKIEGVEKLLKKVMSDDNKVKTDFITALKKEDAEVTDLGKMISKLNAEKIIKLVHLFDYEKNKNDAEKKELRRKYSWDRSKKVEGKFVGENDDYSVSDDDKKLDGDFTKFLYELATDAKVLSSITKPTEQEDNDDKENKEPKKGHFERNWPWYAGAAVLLAGAGGVMAYFWKEIKNWWEPKEGREEYESDE